MEWSCQQFPSCAPSHLDAQGLRWKWVAVTRNILLWEHDTHPQQLYL